MQEIMSFPVKLTIESVNDEGDENTESMDLALTESKRIEDYDEWKRSFSVSGGSQRISFSRVYRPAFAIKEDVGTSYNVSFQITSLGTMYSYTMGTNSIGVQLKEILTDEAEEAGFLEMSVLLNSQKVATGMVTIEDVK